MILCCSVLALHCCGNLGGRIIDRRAALSQFGLPGASETWRLQHCAVSLQPRQLFGLLHPLLTCRSGCFGLLRRICPALLGVLWCPVVCFGTQHSQATSAGTPPILYEAAVWSGIGPGLRGPKQSVSGSGNCTASCFVRDVQGTDDRTLWILFRRRRKGR